MKILLRDWRERRGYSVRKLAKRANIVYVTVVRIENRQVSPTVGMLEKLAKALGITVRDFFPTARRFRGGTVHEARKVRQPRRLLESKRKRNPRKKG